MNVALYGGSTFTFTKTGESKTMTFDKSGQATLVAVPISNSTAGHKFEYKVKVSDETGLSSGYIILIIFGILCCICCCVSIPLLCCAAYSAKAQAK